MNNKLIMTGLLVKDINKNVSKDTKVNFLNGKYKILSK